MLKSNGQRSSGGSGGAMGGRGQVQTNLQQGAANHVQYTATKQPVSLCIMGCCGRGKLMVLWSSSTNDCSSRNSSSLGNLPGSCATNADGTLLLPYGTGVLSASSPVLLDDLPLPAEDDADGDLSTHGEKLGRIQFSLIYSSNQSTLTLKIIRAIDLAPMDITGTSDPYVKIMLLPDKKNKLQTNIKRRNLNPRWNEVFTFEGFPYSKLMNRTLYLQVLDYDRFSRDDPIGEICLPLGDFNLQTEQIMWRTLQPCKGHTGKLGELQISLCYQPTAECITVIVIQARELKSKDINGLSDPYVKIWLQRDGKKVEKRKSIVFQKTLNPVFNETFMFILSYEHIRQTSLEVSVMDYDRLGRNERIGQILLGAKSGPMEVKHWNEMLAKTRQQVTQWHVLKDFG